MQLSPPFSLNCASQLPSQRAIPQKGRFPLSYTFYAILFKIPLIKSFSFIRYWLKAKHVFLSILDIFTLLMTSFSIFVMYVLFNIGCKLHWFLFSSSPFTLSQLLRLQLVYPSVFILKL